MHDRVVVIRSAKVHCLDLPEVGFHSCRSHRSVRGFSTIHPVLLIWLSQMILWSFHLYLSHLERINIHNSFWGFNQNMFTRFNVQQLHYFSHSFFCLSPPPDKTLVIIYGLPHRRSCPLCSIPVAGYSLVEPTCATYETPICSFLSIVSIVLLQSSFGFCQNKSLWPTRNNVLQQDANILVPVGPSLFVVEAQGVQQLVLDDLPENTSLATQRHYLASTATSNKWEAPERED